MILVCWHVHQCAHQRSSVCYLRWQLFLKSFHFVKFGFFLNQLADMRNSLPSVIYAFEFNFFIIRNTIDFLKSIFKWTLNSSEECWENWTLTPTVNAYNYVNPQDMRVQPCKLSFWTGLWDRVLVGVSVCVWGGKYAAQGRMRN